MVYAQPLSEEPVLRGDHVPVTVVRKARAQTIAWLGRFPGADSIGKNYEMSGRVEELARTEQLTGKTGAEKAAPVTGRAVQDQDGVSHYPRRILSRPPEGRVMNAQLRQYRSVSETEARDGEITFTCVPPGSGIRIGIDRDENGVLDGDER